MLLLLLLLRERSTTVVRVSSIFHARSVNADTHDEQLCIQTDGAAT